MENKAYLIGVIATDETPPRFLGTEIFSEETPTLGGNRFTFTILGASGTSYENAINNLFTLLNWPIYQWAKPINRLAKPINRLKGESHE